ncbi:MAG: right-handed parallel beta-helix repeat-containing protein [Kiritimatiellaeota bacterium]|nr:right-handed parallel beta-helix repeat-containing protein [Kiritimatiellota bacterium]
MTMQYTGHRVRPFAGNIVVFWAGVCLSGFLAGTTACAKIVYVDPVRGDDARAGLTANRAVRTLAAGVRLCGPGDTLRILPGQAPLAESLRFVGRSGRPGNPITVDGGGAVLTGLRPIPAEKWRKRGADLWWFPNSRRRGSLRPFLMAGTGHRIPEAPPQVDPLPVGTARWNREGVLFRCAAGLTPADYALRGALAASGVAIVNAGYITIRNLVCEYFANDGFNVHGSCYGLRFENIEARHNGDDGFSVHEDVGAVVNGGWFHENSFGIQDVNASRSMYCGVLVENNRKHGVNFVGGFHSLTDSVCRGNAKDQIRVDRGSATHMHMTRDNPLLSTTVYLGNNVVLGGRFGIAVTAGGRLSVRSCYIAGARTGILAASGTVVDIFGCVVTNCVQRELECHAPEGRFNANVYWPGRIRWGESIFKSEGFGAYRSVSGQDADSAAVRPVYMETGGFLLSGPKLSVGAAGLVPGLRSRPPVAGGRLRNPFSTLEADPAE